MVQILSGDYDAAAATLAGTGSDNEAVAYILSGDLDKAAAVQTGDSPSTTTSRP